MSEYLLCKSDHCANMLIQDANYLGEYCEECRTQRAARISKWSWIITAALFAVAAAVIVLWVA